MSMAGLLVTVAAVAAGLGLLWRFGAFLLAVVAWFLVATMALSLVADIEVPTSAAVLAVLCWAGSQLLTRADRDADGRRRRYSGQPRGCHGHAPQGG